MIIIADQTKQSTGVLINQPTSSLLASSVQPAFKNRSSRVSGKLHRRNQPAFKPYASDQPVLKKIAGPTCHICLLPALPVSASFLPSRRRRPTRSISRRRRSAAASTPPSLAAARLHDRAAAAALLARRHGRQPPFQAAAARPRARPAPPVRTCTARTAARRHGRQPS